MQLSTKYSTQRRDFLRKTSLAAGMASVASVPVLAASTAEQIKRASEPAIDEMRSRLGALEKRVDKTNLTQKKTVKALVILAGISVGVDLSILI